MGKLTQEVLNGLYENVTNAGIKDYAGERYVWTDTWLADASRVDMCWHPSMQTAEVEDSDFGMQLRSADAAERVEFYMDEQLYWVGEPDGPIMLRRLGNFISINLYVRAASFEALSLAFFDADAIVLDPWRHQIVWLYHDRMFPGAMLKGVGLSDVPHSFPDL